MPAPPNATAAQRLLALDPGDVAALTFELSGLCNRTAAAAAKELADLRLLVRGEVGAPAGARAGEALGAG